MLLLRNLKLRKNIPKFSQSFHKFSGLVNRRLQIQIVDELHPEEPQVELPSLDETEPTWPRNAYTLWLREQQNQDSSGMRTLWRELGESTQICLLSPPVEKLSDVLSMQGKLGRRNGSREGKNRGSNI